MDYKVFGCKTNKYFAEKWLAHPHLEEKRGYFIASCVVTDRAKAKWVKHALRILKSLPEEHTLYLSGCGNIRDGVVDPQFYTIYHELSPYKDKIEILPEDPSDFSMSEEEKRKMLQTKIRSLKKSGIRQIFTRKYLVVQTGCDNFCTFCLTVQARWRHKWRPLEEILEEVNAFVQEGWKEIVLTGINLGAWGAQSSNTYTESRFAFLVESILTKTTIERIRISSLGVEFFSDAVIALFTHTRVNAYVHLSIQSGASPILKKMNRHYDGDRVREVLGKLRALQRDDGVTLNIGADLIAGFPGERHEDFLETLALITDFHITQLHAFPFSGHIDHYSVPAGSFPNQVPNHIAQERTKTLLEHGEQEKIQFALAEQGKTLRVLIEKEGPTWSFSGWSENYIACNEHNFIPEDGQILRRGSVILGRYTGDSST